MRSGQVKPFHSLSAAHVQRFGQPVGVNPHPFHLVAPFELDPKKWALGSWIDRYSGKPFRISTDADMQRPDVVLVKAMRDVLAEFRTHPEAKSADRYWKRSGWQTIGLLQRRRVQETFIAHVGTEANRLEEVEAGLENDAEEVRTFYGRPGRIDWDLPVLPRLRSLSWGFWSNTPIYQSDPYETCFKARAFLTRAIARTSWMLLPPIRARRPSH